MAEEIEKVDTSTPVENDGNKEAVDTTETEKKQVEGFDDLDDKDFEDDEKSKEDEAKEPEKNKQENKVEKTFTQTEVDKIVEKRIERLNAKHKAEIERYKKGDYSPEIKSLQDELSVKDTKIEDLQKQLVRYEIDSAFEKEGVADDFKEFVEYKVLRMVGENKDFATCLKEFKTDSANSKYFKTTTGGKSIVPPRPNNSNANTELLAGERALEKSMGL